MKLFLIGILLLALSLNLLAQTDFNEANIVSRSGPNSLLFEPTRVILKFSYSFQRFQDGTQGRESSFTIKPQDNFPKMNLDSILFSSSKYQVLTLHKRFADTSFASDNTNLNYITVHRLSDEEIKFLKTESISEIILFMDHNPVSIHLIKKKSQKAISLDARKTFQ